MNKTKCTFGGIVKGSDGICFKISFEGTDAIRLSKHYKDMFIYMIKSDNIKVNSKKGYHDRKD